MSDQVYILTIPELKRAVTKAKICFIQVRFGVTERWVKISKVEAYMLINTYDINATPKDCEMYAGIFGETTKDGQELYLG